jgi:methylthioribose-1-phosphate isomerase
MDGAIVIVDQTALPHELRTLRLTDVDELVDGIRRLAVRGAPALGAAGALGVLLAVRQGRGQDWTDDEVAKAIDRIRSARPTAVNLAWGWTGSRRGWNRGTARSSGRPWRCSMRTPPPIVRSPARVPTC